VGVCLDHSLEVAAAEVVGPVAGAVDAVGVGLPHLDD